MNASVFTAFAVAGRPAFLAENVPPDVVPIIERIYSVRRVYVVRARLKPGVKPDLCDCDFCREQRRRMN
jgi:hypothetical protein